MAEPAPATDPAAEAQPNFIDVSAFPFKHFQAMARMSEDDRLAALKKATKHVLDPKEVQRIEPMTFLEELMAVFIFFFFVPGSVISIPALTFIIGYLTGQYKIVCSIVGVITLYFTFVPIRFKDSSLTSWWALQILRYFSFKGIFEETLQNHKPYILVAPPHGVFPFGNITTMIAFPSLMGFSFRGLAASAAVAMPFFRQFLCTIGAIDASRSTATKALNKNLVVGISTGGVAEIFETDLSPSGNETIVLKNRKGIVRMAFRTGAGLVPCYLLGNTHLLSLWCGGDENSWIKKSTLKRLSRKFGFGMIFFWGRFLLPIPYRTTIVGLMGKSIDVPKKENPTDEEVEVIHNLLMDKMVELFDKYKAQYGWENKKLVIM